MMTEKFLMIVMTVMSFAILILGLVSFPMMASAGEREDLSRLLAAKDRQLFDNSFGNCNAAEIDKIIAPDFEFYHDKGGATLSKEAFMQDVANGMCKTQDPESGYKSFRVLTEGSLKVFPLYTNSKQETLYGAVQTGEHSFYESYHGSNPQFRSVAKFTHLWMLQDGVWRITRVISYDHQAPAE
ncbi:nuclear transport factor 2 family protein [Paremcibacter congregatus]|nr:nuclear transport factor 2 family protein [Paremcibacter congregatus]